MRVTRIQKSKSRNLSAAKTAKNDEFYTQLTDIEKELKHYRKHFRNKSIFCNCDDPRVSNFFVYFLHSFKKLGLKKLVATGYQNENPDQFSQNKSPNGICFEYSGEQNGVNCPDKNKIKPRKLEGGGDFRSEECVELLKQADIVVTNPAFSLFREYVAQLVEHDKKFLIVGSINAVSYKEVFPLIKESKIWFGYTHPQTFMVPDHCEIVSASSWRDEAGNNWQKLGNVNWFTNLDIDKRHEEMILFKTYDKKLYPAYDNYDAIEVSTIKDIPCDYDDVMGVPITFLDKHNPEQFEIVGIAQPWSGLATKKYPKQIQVSAAGITSTVTKLNDNAAFKSLTRPHGKTYYIVDGEYFTKTYQRILIRHKRKQ